MKLFTHCLNLDSLDFLDYGILFEIIVSILGIH